MARAVNNEEDKRIGHVPSRMCIACGKKAPARELVRAVYAESQVRLDPTRKLAGRGAHVCVDSRCLARAVERRLFSKAFKCNANTDALRRAMMQNDDMGLVFVSDEYKSRTRLSVGR